MKALIGLGGAAVVVALAGAEGVSGSLSTLVALAAVGCWIVSGWIVN